MGKRTSVKASEGITMVVNGRTYSEAEIASILAAKVGRGPGWYDEGADDYNAQIFERILADGSKVRWEIRHDGYVNCHVNLRFHKGRPIPGFGGKRERWAHYTAYFRGADYAHDLKIVDAVAAKVEAKATA